MTLLVLAYLGGVLTISFARMAASPITLSRSNFSIPGFRPMHSLSAEQARHVSRATLLRRTSPIRYMLLHTTKFSGGSEGSARRQGRRVTRCRLCRIEIECRARCRCEDRNSVAVCTRKHCNKNAAHVKHVTTHDGCGGEKDCDSYRQEKASHAKHVTTHDVCGGPTD